MNISEYLIIVLATIGTFFMLISAIGTLRLPDVFSRMHAAGKAASLGISCLLLAAGFYFGGSYLIRMIILTILFFITAPIATTAMARAAYRFIEDRESLGLRYDEMEKR